MPWTKTMNRTDQLHECNRPSDLDCEGRALGDEWTCPLCSAVWTVQLNELSRLELERKINGTPLRKD